MITTKSKWSDKDSITGETVYKVSLDLYGLRRVVIVPKNVFDKIEVGK